MSNIKNDFCFWNVEIIDDKENRNRPVIKFLDNELYNMNKTKQITVDVSISHIKEYATAMAIVKDNRSESLT